MSKPDDMLYFTRNDDGSISLTDMGKALGAYDDLVTALTGKQPTYTEFTAFLVREGYATTHKPDITTDDSDLGSLDDINF